MAEGLSASETEHAVQREIAELQARLDEAQSRLRAIKLAAGPDSSPAPSLTCESNNGMFSYNSRLIDILRSISRLSIAFPSAVI